MTTEKIFIIGDIHGCLGMFQSLMEKIEWNPEIDRLIFLGDYIDRGQEPKGVVDFILAMTRQSRNIECLRGNHEALFMDFLEGRDLWQYLMNGGATTLRSYNLHRKDEDAPDIPVRHMNFYSSLKSYIELDDYYIVHAGFRPGVEIEVQTLEDMMWIRDEFIFSTHDFGKRVIFGHTPLEEPLIMDNKIGLDTGAVYGNALTCLELPRFKFHSVKA